MLTELRRKGGTICQPAKEGKLRCPLIVRPTSEDVITGELFQTLGVINARWWLPDLLGRAFGRRRGRRGLFRKLRMELWRKRPPFPRELLPWDEGSTEVDVAIQWENPPSTLFVEMKYLAPLSASTAGSDGSHPLPADQLARNIRVGLHECGWYGRDQLFPQRPRDFAVIVIAPERGNPLVKRYQNEAEVWNALPHPEKLIGLPDSPFVGELSYLDIVTILRANRRWLNPTEKKLAHLLNDYLEAKVEQFQVRSHRPPATQPELFSRGSPAVESEAGDT